MYQAAAGLRRLGAVASASAVLLGTAVVPALAQEPSPSPVGGPTVTSATHHDTSAPLRTLAATPSVTGPIRSIPADPPAAPATSGLIPPTDVNFEGMGEGLPSDGPWPYGWPPDTNIAVGLTQVVQLVNTSIAVFDKTGALEFGPVPTRDLFDGFGGQCERTNDGDGVVRHDNLANRWVVSQGVFSQPNGLCFAVSVTADAAGSWHRYFFPTAAWPDYQKFGVWPDGYYDMFLGADLKACSLDRVRMLAGQPATMQCFVVADNVGSFMLPSDIEGSTPPPAGMPNLFVAAGIHLSNAELVFQKFHVDWANPANSTLSPVLTVPVTPFDDLSTRIPQPGTSQQLWAFHGRPTYHFGYRNFGDHESLILDFDTHVGEMTGIRWYELRLDENRVPVVHQEGTYAPDDGVHRWMGDLAMDKFGNMALGYSVSNATDVYPGIRYTGRLAVDYPGLMTRGEGVIVNGTGFQTGSYRWGDYSSMSVDPVDDCTFWYSTEYMAAGFENWSTRIAAFHFPGC